MTFDVDAFEERAAIMEFDGGLSRYEAETLSARAQGISRQEAMNARGRTFATARHPGSVARQSRQNHVPAMQPYAKKETR